VSPSCTRGRVLSRSFGADCYGRTPYSGVSELGCLPGRPG